MKSRCFFFSEDSHIPVIATEWFVTVVD